MRREYCLNYNCNITELSECEVDKNMECDYCENYCKMYDESKEEQWHTLGHKVRTINKLLNQSIEYADALNIHLNHLIQAKNRIVKFKDKAEGNMIRDGIIDNHIFY